MNTYVKELKQHCGDFAKRCRSSRWLGAIFHVEVCADIAADIEATERKAAQRAYDAQQADLEAERALVAALSDGKLDQSDEPLVKRALANLRRSAHHDGEISSLLSA